MGSGTDSISSMPKWPIDKKFPAYTKGYLLKGRYPFLSANRKIARLHTVSVCLFDTAYEKERCSRIKRPKHAQRAKHDGKGEKRLVLCFLFKHDAGDGTRKHQREKEHGNAKTHKNLPNKRGRTPRVLAFNVHQIVWCVNFSPRKTWKKQPLAKPLMRALAF